MAISTKHEVEHADGNKRLVVSGVLEHHHAGELCAADEQLEARLLSLGRTGGGGIAYQFEIYIDRPRPEPSAADLDAVVKEAEIQLATEEPSPE